MNSNKEKREEALASSLQEKKFRRKLMRNSKEILPEQSQIWQQVKNYLLERMKEILEAIIEGERDRYIQERGGKEPATGDAV